MLVGVPKEIKDNEYRVGLVPSTVRELTDKGHRVMIETGAGVGAGLPDADYRAAGGEIVDNADAVYGSAELIVKVKEPLAAERKTATKCCSLICISRPTGRRLKTCWLPASPQSPTRR
jgi:alanine dehydrogenase